MDTWLLINHMKKVKLLFLILLPLLCSFQYNMGAMWQIFDPCKALATPYGGGSGTLASPYLICHATHFQNIESNQAAYYTMMTNIDLSTISYTPITAFSGNLNGNGKTISNLVLLDAGTGTKSLGLIISIGSGAVLTGFTLAAPSVQLTNTNVAIHKIGTLAATSAGALSYITIAGGLVTAKSSGTNVSAGGLVGSSTGTIDNVTVNGGFTLTSWDKNTTTTAGIGGVAGYSSGNISNITLSTITVDADYYPSNNNYTGGVVGYMLNSSINNVTATSVTVQGGTHTSIIAGYILSTTTKSFNSLTVTSSTLNAYRLGGIWIGQASVTSGTFTNFSSSSNNVIKTSDWQGTLSCGVARATSGTWSSLSVSDCTITVGNFSNGSNYGGIIAVIENSTFQDSTITNLTVNITNGSGVGGIIGNSINSAVTKITATNIIINGNSNTHNCSPGIMSAARGTLDYLDINGATVTCGSVVGGITGTLAYYFGSTTLKRSRLRGTVTLTGVNQVGAVVGMINNSPASNSPIIQDIHAGDVIANTTTFITLTATDATNGKIGGAFGYLVGATINIARVYTIATITGNGSAGEFIGEIDSGSPPTITSANNFYSSEGVALAAVGAGTDPGNITARTKTEISTSLSTNMPAFNTANWNIVTANTSPVLIIP